MKRFTDKYTQKITGTVECFDRTIFKGHLPISWSGSMENFLSNQGLLIKDFGKFVSQQSEHVKVHAKDMAEKAGRPYIHLGGSVRKEKMAREISRKDGITRGLICIFSAVESVSSFRMVPGERRPALVNAKRKCLCLYFYFLDREFGFLHVRIPTWFPFTMQICINGHDWLSRKLDRHGIEYRKIENAFVWIEDSGRAQHFADRFVRKNWPRILSCFARRVNPLMKNLLKAMDYYWVIDQAEFATDVIFTDRSSLKCLYEKLVKHATLCFSAEDVLTFLGRKLHGRFEGEVLTDYKKRWFGVRVKHRMKENWIKMYDKHGSVLRIETVINHPYEFKVRRRGKRQGKEVMGWFPMAKGVSNLYRYREVSRSANHRYLDALAPVEDPRRARKELHSLARSARKNGRSYRGFNPALDEDVRLFAAVMRGEHMISGFCNKHIRHELLGHTKDQSEIRRQSARISRLLKRLHVHGLIRKIPHSYRWRVTVRGGRIMSMILKLHYEKYVELLVNQAA